ncbi:MAG: hypothetical protein HYZ49_10700 [Chloroflexi bacterium]|nr:hypothetical protein [Chloroflexota bacterium]
MMIYACRLSLILTVAVFIMAAVVACESPEAKYSRLAVTLYPTFDALNEQERTTLPTPPDTRLLYKTTTTAYGRRLQLYYATLLSYDEVTTYYTENLEQAGWKLDGDLFKRGTTCVWIYDSITGDIQIFPIPTSAPGETAYLVWLWHDFFNQPFSIPTPAGVDVCAEAYCWYCR